VGWGRACWESRGAPVRPKFFRGSREEQFHTVSSLSQCFIICSLSLLSLLVPLFSPVHDVVLQNFCLSTQLEIVSSHAFFFFFLLRLERRGEGQRRALHGCDHPAQDRERPELRARSVEMAIDGSLDLEGRRQVQVGRLTRAGPACRRAGPGEPL
jgi:hypothetical protein